VLSERPNEEKPDFGVISINNWRINDTAAKHRLLLDGLGWGGRHAGSDGPHGHQVRKACAFEPCRLARRPLSDAGHALVALSAAQQT
jgi:hypothetical protein